MSSLALATDYLLVMRGAERAFHAIACAWPSAPIYTLLHDPAGVQHRFDRHDVHTSYVQATRVRQAGFRAMFPLFPHAVSTLGTSGYDVVLSNSSAFAHGVPKGDGAVHVCYCHIPFRYAWYPADADRATPRPLRPLARAFLRRVRQRDLRASRRVDHYIASSRLTQGRIERFYGRPAEVVHPPVEVDRFEAGTPEGEFLVVCELVAHKQVDVALEAALRSGSHVKVVGDGPERGRLERRYAGVADFLGRVSDTRLADLYARARALVMPNVEDFGIVAVEAQAAGRPVLGLSSGGATETVIDGETGVLVPPGDVDQMAEAMRHVDFAGFSPTRARENAERFSVTAFRRRLWTTMAGLGVPVSSPSERYG